MADRLIDNHVELNVKSHSKEIRPIICKSKCIIFYNVCHVISHFVIHKRHATQYIRLIFQIAFVRAGLNDSGYTYNLSLCCQMYFQSEDIPNIPESIQLNCDKTSYWVYLSAEKLSSARKMIIWLNSAQTWTFRPWFTQFQHSYCNEIIIYQVKIFFCITCITDFCYIITSNTKTAS